MAVTEGGGCCPVRCQGPILGVACPNDGCGMSFPSLMMGVASFFPSLMMGVYFVNNECGK